MKVAVRADASVKMGTGHVMRCLTLAEELREQGSEVAFICRELEGNLCDYIEQDKGFEVHRLPYPSGPKRVGADEASRADWQRDAEQTVEVLARGDQKPYWLVVDHYALDKRWEAEVRPQVISIMVMDDLADRSHDCDLLLDPIVQPYDQLVPRSCEKLLGTKFVLIRRSFVTARGSILHKRLSKGSPLLHTYFGGKDEGFTTRFCRLVLTNFAEPHLYAIVPNYKTQLTELNALQDDFPARFEWRARVEDLALGLARCDLAFGAPGTTTWERACLGLPSAYLATQENQVPILNQLETLGLCRYLGCAGTISDAEFIERFFGFLSDRSELERMRDSALKLVDGLGVQRVAGTMASMERPKA